MVLQCVTSKLLSVAIIIKIIINVIIANFAEEVEPAHGYTAFPTYILYLPQQKCKKSRFSYAPIFYTLKSRRYSF